MANGKFNNQEGTVTTQRNVSKGRGFASASAKARLARLRKKADIYDMNGERENPDVSDYDRSPEALEHEMPDTRTEWRKEKRLPNGVPAPLKEATKTKEAAAKEAAAKRRYRAALDLSGKALRVARALYANYLPNMDPASQKSLIAHQAEEFMGLPRKHLENTLDRLAKVAELYSAPPEDEMDVEAPDADLPSDLGDDLGGDDYLEDDLDVPSDEELLVCMPAPAGFQSPAAPAPAPAPAPEVDEGMDDLDSELGLDEAPMAEASARPAMATRRVAPASRRVKARDAQHWEKSVMDVDTPSEDYQSESADYYESGSNSERGEEQLLVSNPVAASGPRSKRADGETSVSDPGGLNPWDEDEDYHDFDDHSYEESPQSVRFEEQMAVSNPVKGKDATSRLLDQAVREATFRGRARAAIQEPEAQPTRRVASSGKAGVKTVGGLGRTAARKSREHQDAEILGSLWKTAPRLPKN